MAGPRLRYRSNHVLTLLLAAIVVAAIVSHAAPALAANVRMTLRGEQPRTEPWNIRHHLGTKSPYWPQNPARTPVPSGCQLANVNLVARHGSREPTQKDIDRLSRLADKFHTYAQYITDPQLAWLKSWQNPVDPRNAGLLALTGQNEHYALAKRMMAEYAPLLSQQYYPYTYIFQSTQVSRAGASASSFAYGMLQNRGMLGGVFQPPYIFTESLDQDTELRFFDNCPAYQAQKDSPQVYEQADRFGQIALSQVASALSQYVGVAPHWVFSIDELTTMWSACGFEVAIANDTSHFCTLFNQVQAELLEYNQDLLTYWQKGYGFSINYEPACSLLTDIVDVMGTIVSNTSTMPLAKFRFAHAETIMPFVALLGVYQDPVPLMADSDLNFIVNRKWRSSVISPFAANVAFSLYRCETAQPEPQWLVRTMINEVEIKMPGCGGSIYCPYEQFIAQYEHALTCNYCAICFSDSASSNQCVCPVA